MPGGSNFTLCLLFVCFAKLLLVQNQTVAQNYTNKQYVKPDNISTSLSNTGSNKLYDKSKSISSTGRDESDNKGKSISSTGPDKSDNKSTSISSTGSVPYDDKSTSISSTGSVSYDDKSTSISSTGFDSYDDKSTSISSTGSVPYDDKSTSISSTGFDSYDDKSTSISSTESIPYDDKSTSISNTGSNESEVNSTPITSTYPTMTGVRGTSVIQTFTTVIPSEETTPVTTVHDRSCNNTSNCDDKMECWNSKCVCQLDHYWSGNNQTCLQIVFDSQINITDVTNTSVFLDWTEPDIDVPENSFIQYSVMWEAGGNVTSENVSTETSYIVQKLLPGENYAFSVVLIIFDEGRSKNISSSLRNVTTVPDPPDSMNISSNFGPDITLTFCGQGHISYCNVTVGGNGFNFTNTSENCKSLEVPGLENGTFYTVEVTAISGDKISTGKMFFFNTTASEPGPVRNLTVTNITATSVVLTWLPPEHPNGHNVSYNITVSDNFDSCVQEFDPIESLDENIKQYVSTCMDYEMEINGTTTAQSIISGFSDIQLKITNLTSCVFYKITVSAFNMECACLGVGDSTNFTTNTSVPSEPTNLALRNSTPHWIEITWNETNKDPCNRTYLVELCDPANETVFKSITSNDSNNSVTFTELPSYHEFYVNLTAMTESENSTTVKSESVYTRETAASAVRGLNITSATNNSLFVTWQKPDELNGVMHFYLARVTFPNGTLYCSINISEEESNDLKQLQCNETDMIEAVNGRVNLTLNNLLPDTNYTLNVTAVNGAGEGNWTQITGKTDIAVPNPVMNFNMTNVNCTSVTLHWDPPSPRPGPTNYTININDMGSVYYNQNGCAERDNNMNLNVKLEGYDNTTYTFNNLTAAWKYSFTLTSSTAKGQSAVSINQSTTDCEPGVVENLHNISIPNEYYAVQLVWKCPCIRERNTDITGFDITILNDHNETINNRTIEGDCDANETQYTTINVEPENTYHIKVMILGLKNSTLSANLTYTAPSGPSEKVQDLTVSSVNFTTISVSWTRPNVTNGNITCSVILLNGTSDGNCLQTFVLSNDNSSAQFFSNDCSQNEKPNVLTSNDTQTIYISQLQPEASYIVTVIPYNSYGPGISDTTNVTLPAGPSEKVSCFSVEDVSNTTVTVIWTKPNVTNGQLTGYVLDIAQVGSDSRKTICFGKVGSDSRKTICFGNTTTASCDNSESINDPMRYTARDFPPDTEIELTLYPINSAGNGNATTIRNKTLEAAPSVLQNVTFEFLQNNIIEFKWIPPKPRPGVTNYSLTVSHSQKPYEKHDYEVEHLVNMSGWNTSRTVANYSYNGWEYLFQLDVFTAVGRPPPFVLNISTPEADPGKVQNLSVVPNKNDFNSIDVTWECPKPEERNGRIQNFTFSNYQLTKSSLGERNTSRTLKLEKTNCELKTFKESIPVLPGNTYIFQVFANNENFTGNITTYTYNTSIGPPPLLTFEIALSDISPTTSSSFSVQYCPACLVNTINGEIIYTAVVVCANNCSVSENLSSLTFIRTMNTWHNASEENFKTIYRPTNESWVHEVQMNSNQNGSFAVYVVGSDENCRSTPGEYCNGPLPSGRAFKVAFVTCTQTACSPSNFSEDLWTAEEDTADMGAIVGGVLGSICAVAAVLCFVWYRRREARKQHSLHYDPVDMEILSFNVRPVPMHDFKDKVQEWMSQEKTERGMPVLLAEQFKEIKELSEKKHSQDAALQDENKGKNRYTNILPYDHSRVKLSIHDNEDSSDFINANYIPGYHSKREYIATQGPLESTVNDFWQMVWEQQVPAILMLSGFMEGRTVKVHAYYPTDNTLFQSISYGAVTVMLKEVVETAGYTRKTFEIERNRQSRTVYHFYIKGWKDYDANLPVNPVLAFVQAVRDLVPVNSKHPLLVHCSAGVGRTGTIIGIDYFMHYVREQSLSEPIDIFRYVLLMREYRPSMVQSCEQYVFLHKAVAELVRRKKDPDHYDEPVYTNMAYEEDEHMYANC